VPRYSLQQSPGEAFCCQTPVGASYSHFESGQAHGQRDAAMMALVAESRRINDQPPTPSRRDLEQVIPRRAWRADRVAFPGFLRPTGSVMAFPGLWISSSIASAALTGRREAGEGYDGPVVLGDRLMVNATRR
jgi:hypothetical protein